MPTLISCGHKCALCDFDLPKHPVIDGDFSFCCSGCHAVYQVLQSQNQVDSFEDHPVFKQALEAGLISNPDLLHSLRKKKLDVSEDEIHKLHLEVEGLWCPSCAQLIKLILMQEKGVRQCVVDYSTDLASIEYAPRYLSKEKIFSIIKSLGYHAERLQDARGVSVSRALYYRLGIAAFFALNIMMLSYPIYASHYGAAGGSDYITLFAWLSAGASLPVVFYSAWPILCRFYHSVKYGIMGMETLVVIGVATAFFLSFYELLNGGTKVYFDSMCMLIFFVLLGKVIESKAKFSAKDSLLQLTRALPRRGRRDDMSFVPIKDFKEGDVCVAIAGETCVLDGFVVKGEGACDESLMTGESIPIPKKNGDKILAGTLLQSGNIHYQVSRSSETTALQKIIEMVEQDIGQNVSLTPIVDRIVKRFVPAVLLLTVFVAAIKLLLGYPSTEVLLQAISILLISCPCAIGIAAPLAESRLLNSFAKLGVIVRNRCVLPFLGKEDVLFFDKTGTITEGHFTVISGLEQLSSEDQRILKTMTMHSNHPISLAVAAELEVEPCTLEYIEELVGKGIRAFDDDQKYLFGSETLMKEEGYFTNCQSDLTLVFFTRGNKEPYPLVLGDRIREDAKDLIQAFSNKHTVLLSGDREAIVANVAKTCAFKEAYALQTPLDKREKVEEAKRMGKIVMVVGDGINDAPALTASHVGISVVTASDISIQVSDILLTTERLSVLPKMSKLGSKGQRIIKLNLFWAFCYNIIGIGLAVYGVLSPLFAALAMVLSSLIVIFNTLRLK